MRRHTLRLGAAATATVVLTGLAGCGVGEDDGKVTIELFQFKSEAGGTFEAIAKDFEAEHPDIDVVVNNSPNAETAIRTRLVKNDVPDVITLNGNSVFGELASAGVFHDFAGDPVAEDVNPAIQQILDDLGTHGQEESNGLPFASNANGVIYNKDLFEKHGVEPPRTWDEMIAAAEKFEAEGVNPFFFTLKDAWVSLPPFNALASNIQDEDFFEELEADRTSFEQVYPPVVDKLEQLFSYAQDGYLSRDYNSGNQAFAAGQSAMYLQGSYAIPAIKSFEPDFEIGTFALPPFDDAEQTRLVSGVDVALTMGRDPEHPEESMQLIRYLMRPEVVQRYAEEQFAVPPLEGLTSDAPELEGLLPYFEQGRLVGYTDHHIPLTIGLDAILQEFLLGGDREAVLEELDDEWDKVAARRA
ncbi:MAG TPA: extracellular solute-binding protein [Nocardioidaceae bacterium]|nr:extracellular solute-binding protein [Nocardioidaceae bacterium]